jgi:CO/xanthine dehydrogenase FAD-binding subunit
MPAAGQERNGIDMGSYQRPTELEQGLQALAGGNLTIVAGGTDYYPARVERPLAEDVLDVSGLSALRAIEEAGEDLRIGAGVTWSDLIATRLPRCFDGLKQAAREVGGRQIQNAGTIAGNLCNASPAADGVPPLLALDARVELASLSGTRELPLAAFITGNRRTNRRPDELMTAILVRPPARPVRSRFLKLGARKYLVISIVMVAALVEEAENGTVAAARIAVGACSAVAQRLPDLEAALVGRRLEARLGGVVEPVHLAALSPIDDIRGPASYRRDAALILTRRILAQLGQGA